LSEETYVLVDATITTFSFVRLFKDRVKEAIIGKAYQLKNRIHSLLKEQLWLAGEPFLAQIEILTSMKGISVFCAIAIIADVIDIKRFKDSKHFTMLKQGAYHYGRNPHNHEQKLQRYRRFPEKAKKLCDCT
jgi:hypothetical protein